MMPIEQRVTNLEISKTLHKLGVKQDSLWYYERPKWMKEKDELACHLHLKSEIDWKYIGRQDFPDYISAFTVAELGEMLPRGYLTVWGGQHWQCFKIVDIRCCPVAFEQININADTEANARGKMKIYLIEQGLVKV